MKAISARATAGLNLGAKVVSADNSGAEIVRIVSVKRGKGKKGVPDMKGKVFDAIVIRQKKPYRRLNGERIMFEDNAVAILKDEKGNPKGTKIKGPIAREVQERWGSVAKIASIVY